MFRLDAHLIWLLFGDFQPSMWFCFGMRQNGKSLKKLAVTGNQIHGPRLVCQVTPISLSRGLFRTCTCEVLLLLSLEVHAYIS